MKGVFLCEYDIDMVHKSIDSAKGIQTWWFYGGLINGY